MYVRMLWGRLRPGMWNEYERLYNEHIEQITQGMSGFQGRQLLQSAENPDEGVSVTLWDSLEALRDYERSPRRQDATKLAENLYTGEYWVRHFEVKSSTI